MKEKEAIVELFEKGLSDQKVANEIMSLGSEYSLKVGHVGNAHSTVEMLLGIIRELVRSNIDVTCEEYQCPCHEKLAEVQGLVKAAQDDAAIHRDNSLLEDPPYECSCGVCSAVFIYDKIQKAKAGKKEDS